MKKLVSVVFCLCFLNFAIADDNKNNFNSHKAYFQCQHDNQEQSCHNLTWLTSVESMALLYSI